jgi:lipopolysaccharide export system protein LptC
MYGRPTILFPIALLALLALLTFWIERTVQQSPPKQDGSNRHDPDYILNNFVTTKTDINGDLRYRLIAEEMKHFPDDDSTELKKPHFTRYEINKPYTKIEGDRGLVSSDGENIQFMDNVKVVRQAFQDKGEMVLLTEYLNIIPDKDLATTDRPVVITQAPKTVIHGTGMIYNKKEKTLKLLSRVKVHYERPVPPKKPVKAKPKNAKSAQGKKAASGKTVAKNSSSTSKSTSLKSTTTQKNTQTRR